VPTYAMTESFPICSNPPHLEVKLATVGPAMGPSVSILNAHPDDTALAPGAEGEVCVRGACVTSGYLMRPDHMSVDPNLEAFSSATSSVGRMLRTGDKGYVDADGYLQLVGRFKEIINCAGEKISPLELEDQLLGVEGVETCVCFAAPAQLLGEVVGVACVVQAGATPPTIESLRAGVSSVGDRFKPAVLVYLDEIPKGPTGKPKRIGLAKHLGLPSLTSTNGTATYTISGRGEELGPLLFHTKRWDGTPVIVPGWQFPIALRLEMNPDLAIEERSTHVLEIADAECTSAKLTVVVYNKEGRPFPKEFVTTPAYAKEAMADVRLKTAERGMQWAARTGVECMKQEDFAADLYAYDGNKVLHHSWRAGCNDTPPGKLMRLLGVLETDEAYILRTVAEGERLGQAGMTGGSPLPPSPPPLPISV